MATSHTPARIARMRRDTLMRELEVVAAQITANESQLADLYATRLLMYQRGRNLTPPVTNRVLAEATGVTEPRVIQQLNKAHG